MEDRRGEKGNLVGSWSCVSRGLRRCRHRTRTGFGAPDPSVSATNGSIATDRLSSVEDNSPECSSYRGYTAALAKATIDCLGTVGPSLYGLSEKGLLERRFDECLTGGPASLSVKPAGLLRIDRLLSLQVREATLPNVLKCIPEVYDRAQRALIQQGISDLPYLEASKNDRHSRRWQRLSSPKFAISTEQARSFAGIFPLLHRRVCQSSF